MRQSKSHKARWLKGRTSVVRQYEIWQTLTMMTMAGVAVMKSTMESGGRRPSD
jgi:hypothetical protein